MSNLDQNFRVFGVNWDLVGRYGMSAIVLNDDAYRLTLEKVLQVKLSQAGWG